MAKKHGPDCKEYFNCRSTREFRAHIRRSTDLSRAQQGGLLAFSETKNKEACRDGRGVGNERCDCTCSPASLVITQIFERN